MSSTSTSRIILYDVPRRDQPPTTCTAWSPNVWRTRYGLNLKKLAYKTEWVEYPDIKQVYDKHGLAVVNKTPDGSPWYTLPVIYDPLTKTAVADSFSIAKYLDETYPETATLLPSATVSLQRSVYTSFWPIVHVHLFKVLAFPAYRILNERSQEYYRPKVERIMGQKLEDICGQAEWQAAEAAFGFVADWLNEREEGSVLFTGEGVCFVDVMVAGCLIWAREALGRDSVEWQNICRWHGGRWHSFLDAFNEYSAVF